MSPTRSKASLPSLFLLPPPSLTDFDPSPRLASVQPSLAGISRRQDTASTEIDALLLTPTVSRSLLDELLFSGCFSQTLELTFSPSLSPPPFPSSSLLPLKRSRSFQPHLGRSSLPRLPNPTTTPKTFLRSGFFPSNERKAARIRTSSRRHVRSRYGLECYQYQRGSS